MRTGVDIVEIKRIEKILNNKKESFYRKIFTNSEVEYIESNNNNPKTVSGIFAAKEAVSKVIGTGIGEVGWKDIEVLHNEKGRPFININLKIREILNEQELNDIDISISHEREYAISFAIGFKNN